MDRVAGWDDLLLRPGIQLHHRRLCVARSAEGPGLGLGSRGEGALGTLKERTGLCRLKYGAALASARPDIMCHESHSMVCDMNRTAWFVT